VGASWSLWIADIYCVVFGLMLFYFPVRPFRPFALGHFWAKLCCIISLSDYYGISCYCCVLQHALFYYAFLLPRKFVQFFTDTRLGLEGVALLDHHYLDVQESL
jgi:hypothetical protein